MAKDTEELFRDHWTKILSNDNDNNLDYDHVTEIENSLINKFEQIRTYDYRAIYRLDKDFPSISLAEFSNTLRTFRQKAPGPSKITTLQLKKFTTKHDRIFIIYLQPINISRILSGYLQTSKNDLYIKGK